MVALQNITIAIAVTVIAMACMVFGDWVARGKRQPDHWYCQNAKQPQNDELGTAEKDPAAKEKEARKTANERYHELCNQWRAAEAAEDATRVAWIQLWFGLGGLGGLLATVYFAAKSASAAADAARETSRSVDVQQRVAGPLVHVDEVFTRETVPNDLHVRMRNSGNTPAILIEHTVECAVGEWTLPAVPAYGKATLTNEELLSKDKTTFLMSFIRDPGLAPVFDGTEPAVMWGYVIYEDVFGRRRRRGFGYASGAVGGSASILILQDFGGHSIAWGRSGGETYNYDREEKPQNP